MFCTVFRCSSIVVLYITVGDLPNIGTKENYPKHKSFSYRLYFDTNGHKNSIAGINTQIFLMKKKESKNVNC